jgi:hypothetical protein
MRIMPKFAKSRGSWWGGLALSAGLVTLLAHPLPASGQPGFALRGGVNLSRFVGGDADAQSKSGLNLGGAMHVFGVGPVELWVEGYYRQKGGERLDLESAATAGTTPFTVGLEYVEIPVLLRLNLPTLGEKVRPYLQGGPAFGWRMDCSVSVSGTSPNGLTPDCDSLLGGGLEETLKDYEQGIVLGGGVDFDILGRLGSVNLDARLTRGLSRLATAGAGDGLKNQSFSLMLGYALNPSGLMPGG